MFRTNVPVTAAGFHDRRRELELLEGLARQLELEGPRWLAIVGPRKIGKTSILLELARRCASPSLLFVVIDTFEQLPVSLEIFRRFALRLLDAALSAELDLSLEALARDPARYRTALQRSERFTRMSPELRGQLLELADQQPNEALVESALRLPEQIATSLDVHVLVAWDEFQELGDLGAGRRRFDLFPLMRSIWQRQERVSYVVSGSRRTMLSELVTSERSPFFQHFSLMDLGPFDFDDAVAMLEDCAPDDRPVSSQLARRAVEAIGGHPFYLQLLGEVLTSRLPPYGGTALKDAVQELLFSRTGRLSLYFDGVYSGLVGRSTQLAATLQALADGPRRLTDVAQAIGAPSGSTVRYIERLGDAVARTDEGLYRIVDSTFATWLRWRRPGGTVVPMSVIGDEAELRVAEHLASLGFDLVYQSRASRGAFDLLATRGAQQLGLQVKRSKLPLRFAKSEWARFEAEGKRLGWSWVIVAVPPPPETEILVLDPARAKRRREVRLTAGAAIENLLLWLSRAGSCG